MHVLSSAHLTFFVNIRTAERNVFYKMCCEHGLPYECVCPGPRRCQIKLGDFDAMVVIQSQSSHIMGTKNYRPPEVTKHASYNITV